MNLKGKGTTITVKTLNGKVMENSKVTEGFEASNSSDFGQGIVRWLRLPKSYTRKYIPVDIIKQWHYQAMTLSSQINYPNGSVWIKSRVSFVARKTKNGLLIVANCARAPETEGLYQVMSRRQISRKWYWTCIIMTSLNPHWRRETPKKLMDC